MRDGKHPDGAHVLRAKIDMESPNINMRDPALYRIKNAEHHRTGDKWHIYPMYSYAHPIEDALENITHSLCTLEFEDQRPFYDWVLERIVPRLRRPQYEAARAALEEIRDAGIEAKREFALHCRNVVEEKRDKLGASRYERRAEAMFASWSKNPDLAAQDADEFFKLLLEHTECFTPLLQSALDERKANPFLLPHQYEFNRLNLTYVVMSKRKLIQLVEEKHVDGWDDPRMPTIVGLRRRGYTPAEPAALCRPHGRQQEPAVDRLQPARTGAARRPRSARAARYRGAEAPEARARQLPGRPNRGRAAAGAPTALGTGHAHDPIRT